RRAARPRRNRRRWEWRWRMACGSSPLTARFTGHPTSADRHVVDEPRAAEVDRGEYACGRRYRGGYRRQGLGLTDFEVLDREAGLFEVGDAAGGLARDRFRFCCQCGGNNPPCAGESG